MDKFFVESPFDTALEPMNGEWFDFADVLEETSLATKASEPVSTDNHRPVLSQGGRGKKSSEESEDGSRSQNGSESSGGREKNKAACAKYREKRKRKAQELQQKHEELLEGRKFYLERIADLEAEVQLLRCRGEVDLRKENELLLAEVTKHRKFVHDILKVAQALPSSVPPEETFRLVNEGVESGVAQILGLAYTSMVDPTWQEGQMLDIFGWKIRVRFQYLPRGSTVTDAKRLNIRFDAIDFPSDFENTYDKFWLPYSCPSEMQHCKLGQVKEIHLPGMDQLPKGCAVTRDAMKMFRYVENGSEYTFVSAKQEVKAFPSALLLPGIEDEDGVDSHVELPVKLIVQTTTSTEVLRKANLLNTDEEENAASGETPQRRVEATTLLGLMVWRHPASLAHKESCRLTMVETYPLNDEALNEMETVHRPTVDPVTGTLDAPYVQAMHDVVSSLFPEVVAARLEKTEP